MQPIEHLASDRALNIGNELMNFLIQTNCVTTQTNQQNDIRPTKLTVRDGMKSKNAPSSPGFRGARRCQPALCTVLVLASKHYPVAAWLLLRAHLLTAEVSTWLNTRILSDELPLITAMPLSGLIFVAVGTRRQNSDANLVVPRSLHLTWSDLFGLQHMSVLMRPFRS